MRPSSLLALAATLLPSIAVAQESPAPAAKRKPNIILIMADDLGYGDLGSYGQDKIATPHLDRLASEGRRFTDFYSGSTVCAPARCTLLTGKHTGHAFIRGNGEIKPLGQRPIPAEEVTLAEVMRSAGYRTGMVGKWGLGGPQTEGAPNAQGFDEWYGYLCQRRAHRYYPEFLWRNAERVEIPANAEGARGAYAGDLFTAEALEFVRRSAAEPFFLYLPYTTPHADLDVPDDSIAPYREGFEEKPHLKGGYRPQPVPHAAFAGMVSRLDRDVGALLSLLEELGLQDDTLVLFTSDNGPHREGGADPKFFNSSGGLRGIKRDLYEGGIRVPLIARWPGHVPAGTTSGHAAAFWDVLATCADLVGEETTAPHDGLSFANALLGREGQAQHEFLYWEFEPQGGKQAIRVGDWKGVRLGLRKNADAPLELYDLSRDPGETTNVAAQHPEVVEKMLAYLASERVESEIWPLFGK